MTAAPFVSADTNVGQTPATAKLPSERLLTRKEAIELVRQEFGLPIAASSFQCGQRKLQPCSDGPGGPRISMRFGRRTLYRVNDVRAWAQALIDKGKVR